VIPAVAITESRLQYALSLVLSFEFEVWQDAERNTGRDRLDRRDLQHDPAKILSRAARNSA
jgi:hypothetical protein